MTPGLRQQKKAATRAAIQRQALRLFREQGYEATTASQIAAAANVSESTFFRYFPTKEDVVRWDELDPPIFAALRAEPPSSPPITAMRAAFRQVLDPLSAAERAELRQRLALLLDIPPLRSLESEQLSQPMRELASALAERHGRSPDDLSVRTAVGAVMGVGLVALLAAAEDEDADVPALLDQAMAYLEAGLPL